MKLRFALIVCLLLFIFLPSGAAQPRRRQVPDAASLRAKFLAAVETEFELVKDEFKSHPSGPGTGTYWLAHVKPKHTGHVALQYSFKPKGQHYSHVEHEIYFTVAPKACRRGSSSYGVYSRFCIGDTIIIPIIVEASADGHQFKLRKTPPSADEDWKTFEEKYPEARYRDLDKTPVDNPSEILRYVGRIAHKAFHRGPGYTLRLDTHFEAAKPGKLNLMVSSSVAAPTTAARSIPVIVVDQGTPVTLIAGREEVRGYSVGANGQEYVSSTSGNSYGTTLHVLQPGDRISVQYFSVSRGAKFEREGRGRNAADPAEATMPVISVHPFAHDPTYDYGGWLVGYLP
jgi:hypothetical protein